MPHGFARLDRVLRWGLILFVVGSGPLILIMLAAALGLTRDPNPNPIAFGILCGVTFWPAVLMIGIGAWRTRRARRAGP